VFEENRLLDKKLDFIQCIGSAPKYEQVDKYEEYKIKES
jgi:hypothetical protein